MELALSSSSLHEDVRSLTEQMLCFPKLFLMADEDRLGNIA